MEQRIKVLHILHELHPSGAEMMIYNAYPYWKDTCECTILATGKQKGPFAEKLEQAGYQTAWVCTNGTGKAAKIAHLISFWKFMKKNCYDVVHIHRESLSFEYALIAKLAGTNQIVRTVHSTFAHKGIQRKIKSMTRFLMKHLLSVSFAAISDGVAENEKKVFGNQCAETIYNWCNNKKFLFVSEEEKQLAKEKNNTKEKLVLLTVGNCGNVKNHELLIRAIAKMKYREEIFYYHVGFAPKETEREQQLAKELGISNQIVFAGSTDPMPYLKEADIFVMTSLYEGLSIAALEAIFTGMNLLLANVSGLTEFRGKGLCNVDYFQPNENALAEKLDEDTEKWKQGLIKPSEEQSMRAAKLYDCKTQAEKYTALYQKLLHKNSGK